MGKQDKEKNKRIVNILAFIQKKQRIFITLISFYLMDDYYDHGFYYFVCAIKIIIWEF